MESITREYLLLFNAITDIQATLLQLNKTLVSIQQQAEDLFLERADSPE